MIHEDHARSILEDVATERTRQDAKWDEQNHTPVEWVGILAEEFGEAAMAANKLYWGGANLERVLNYRLELIETAAVAVAAIEDLDRNLEDAVRDDLGAELDLWKERIDAKWREFIRKLERGVA